MYGLEQNAACQDKLKLRRYGSECCCLQDCETLLCFLETPRRQCQAQHANTNQASGHTRITHL
jgi:hypothetical protein